MRNVNPFIYDCVTWLWWIYRDILLYNDSQVSLRTIKTKLHQRLVARGSTEQVHDHQQLTLARPLFLVSPLSQICSHPISWCRTRKRTRTSVSLLPFGVSFAPARIENACTMRWRIPAIRSKQSSFAPLPGGQQRGQLVGVAMATRQVAFAISTVAEQSMSKQRELTMVVVAVWLNSWQKPRLVCNFWGFVECFATNQSPLYVVFHRRSATAI